MQFKYGNLVPRAFPLPTHFLREKPWGRGCKYGGFWRLKSVRGTQNVVTERRTRKTVEKKTPAKEKKLNHTFIFDQC